VNTRVDGTSERQLLQAAMGYINMHDRMICRGGYPNLNRLDLGVTLRPAHTISWQDHITYHSREYSTLTLPQVLAETMSRGVSPAEARLPRIARQEAVGPWPRRTCLTSQGKARRPSQSPSSWVAFAG